jgi:hypothetical protein
MRSSVVQEVKSPNPPAPQLIHDTAPVGLACLSADCRVQTAGAGDGTNDRICHWKKRGSQ